MRALARGKRRLTVVSGSLPPTSEAGEGSMLKRKKKEPPEPSKLDLMDKDNVMIALETALMLTNESYRALSTDAPKDVLLTKMETALETALAANRSLQRRVAVSSKIR